MIDKRLAGIDANFKEFQMALAQENVRADFGIAVVQVGIGGAGANPPLPSTWQTIRRLGIG